MATSTSKLKGGASQIVAPYFVFFPKVVKLYKKRWLFRQFSEIIERCAFVLASLRVTPFSKTNETLPQKRDIA